MPHQVIVVGGGPVGLMTACELRVAGVQVLLIERLAAPTGQSRALGLNSRSLEVLAQRGFAGPFLARGAAWPAAHFAGFVLDMARAGGPYPYALMISQADTEALLTAQATALGAEIRRDCELTGLRQEDGRVTLEVRSGGERGRLECDYLVGCDGGRSTVRELAGIGFPGTDPTLYAVLGDVTSVDESIDIRRPHVYPGGIFGIAPLGPGVFRVSTVEYGRKPPPGTGPVDRAEFEASIRRVTGRSIGIGEPLWLSRFDDRTRLAERYRADRVFLAGDAAHIHFPLAGQGMNVGIQDAVNLGWKLGAAVHGWAPPGLLDSYHDERHPVGERLCLNTRAQSALTLPVEWTRPLRTLFGDLLKFEPVHRHLTDWVSGTEVRYETADPDGQAENPLLGRRLALDAAGAQADGAGWPASLRSGRGVLVDLSGGTADLREADAWHDRVDVAAAGPRPELGAQAVLVRPDGHVCWAGTADTKGLADALGDWFGPA
jgi:3-(3-hydroxy-phenyl)propionate hydroxylase/bifunctional hydroxylase/dehydrase